MKKNLINTARRIRKELEGMAESSLSPNGQPHLGGLCGYGTTLLVEEFQSQGLNAQAVSGCCHWFCLCEGYLVDVTASQFGMGRVVVRNYEKVQKENKKNLYARSFWTAGAIGTLKEVGLSYTQKELANYRENGKWSGTC